MRTRKVTVHYCDHCSKRMFQIPAMAKHEKHCTRNFDRECRMCSFMYNEDSDMHATKPLPELISILGKGDDEGVEKLREAAGGCPACIMAAVNFHNRAIQEITDHMGISSLDLQWVYFDWKEERKVWDAAVREIFAERHEEWMKMVGSTAA